VVFYFYLRFLIGVVVLTGVRGFIGVCDFLLELLIEMLLNCLALALVLVDLGRDFSFLGSDYSVFI